MDWPILDRQSVVPLYYQIQQSLLESIRSGKLKPGKPIPSEGDISKRLRVSRMTARQAMKSLCSLGVAYSQRGKGTFVSSIKLEKNFRQVLSFTDEMAASGVSSRSKLIALDVLPTEAAVAEALHLDPQEEIIRLCRVRIADSVPMGVETAHLAKRLCPGLLEQFDPRTSLYQALARFCGIRIAFADEAVEAGLAGPEDARLLAVAKGSPVFVFTRTSHLEGGQAVEYVKSVYRGDRFKLVNRLTPKEGW